MGAKISARTNNVFFPLSEVCDGSVSLMNDNVNVEQPLALLSLQTRRGSLVGNGPYPC